MATVETAQREISYVQAFQEALAQVMREDPDVFVAGEDVAGYGGVFGTFKGLLAEFGPERVVDTPIAENAIVGLGVGAAVAGLRPVVDIMFMDFTAQAMDQIVNNAAKLKYMFGGKARLPMVITTHGGAGLSAAAQHSQNLEAWICHVPGLKVVAPSGPYEAKGLLVAAIRDDNPVYFVGNKLMLGATAHVPEELYEIPLGQAAVVREGDDVTVVATGRMVGEALAAAERLAGEGTSVEVIDPRTLQPLDTDTITASARKTNRVLVVHEAVRFGGIGAEVAAQVQEAAFDYLDAPVHRIGAPFSPTPFSPALEQLYVPNRKSIAEGIRETLGRPVPGA